MASIKNKSTFVAMVLAVLLALNAAQPVFAESTEEAAEKATQLSNISQNCSSIKQSLTKLQYADSRTRSYLGGIYETIANTFITPLNLRLVKNNYNETAIFEIQTSFVSAQSQFRLAYTDYMRELDNLINTDCQTHPEDFLDHLEQTRTRRLKLQNTTIELSGLINQQLDAVASLKGAL